MGDNSKMNIEVELDSMGLTGQVVDSCECNEPPGSIKCGEFLD
jgi:hypothetical protein